MSRMSLESGTEDSEETVAGEEGGLGGQGVWEMESSQGLCRETSKCLRMSEAGRGQALGYLWVS